MTYSPHNTLIATGLVSSSASTNVGISALTSINSNSIKMNKLPANMVLPSNTIVNSSNNQGVSAGFTKIFINGTGNNSSK